VTRGARERLAIASLAAIGLAAGCERSATEVVLVIDTDLSLPDQADTLSVRIASASFNQGLEFGPGNLAAGYMTLPSFPTSLGILPHAGEADAPFDVTVALETTRGAMASTQPIVQRSATGVHFVEGQTRLLFIALPRSCACAGTQCPSPLSSPQCADLVAPVLSAFDPAHLPRVSEDGGVAPPDAAASTDADADAADAPFDTASDVAHDAAVESAGDGAFEARDAAADALSDVALNPNGYTCTDKATCASGSCVDNVCCENACTCGTCGGATPGTCTPAAAGTDPRNACGAYTCDGAGACRTTCPEAAFGACSTSCKTGESCNGAGACTVSSTGPGFFCVVGTCMCQGTLTCQAPDGGGAGKCL
jgi:hypothetical protein